MAPPSPRRSSRARLNNSQSQQSSASSNTSSRNDRVARPSNRAPSGKSTPSASLSSEPPEDVEDFPLLRPRKRLQEDDRDRFSRPSFADMANGSADLQDDDEAVRCICGFDDYPGPPPLEDARHAKDGQDAEFFNAIEQAEDVSGFFVQCDICKVWQHGACVGIMTEESSPDEYFCEKCRKDLHKIHVASNGQRYSIYLPLRGASPNTSRATSLVKDGTRSPKNGANKTGRASTASQASKRRSTQNSREAGYNEEEILRRVLEASKEDAIPDPSEVATSRAKRSRSDSEENAIHVKRQRTSSRSVSPLPADSIAAATHDMSDDGTGTRNGSKKPRLPRSQRSDREEQERQRQDAASKRNGRTDRRRTEDSDPSEEIPLAAARAAHIKSSEAQASIEPPAPAPPVLDTPPAVPVQSSNPVKKSSKGSQKKGKGRNQYTRDRDTEMDESPARSMSRDIQRNPEEASNHSHTASRPAASERTQVSRPRIPAHSKISITDIKRRSGAFLDFISKTQLELATEDAPEPILAGEAAQDGQGSVPKILLNGNSGLASKPAKRSCAPTSPQNGSKDFKDLDCVEMMDVLTRDVLKWQGQYS